MPPTGICRTCCHLVKLWPYATSFLTEAHDETTGFSVWKGQMCRGSYTCPDSRTPGEFLVSICGEPEYAEDLLARVARKEISFQQATDLAIKMQTRKRQNA